MVPQHMPNWHLEDADALATSHRYTFYKPSRELIARVRVGETVRLIVRFDTGRTDASDAEGLWVVVEAIQPGEVFEGRLKTPPRWITDLKPGDPIRFHARHITRTEHGDPDHPVHRYARRCFVTGRVIRDGRKVGYLYREAAEDAVDSGWRFTAGDESEAYMADTDNIVYLPLGQVLTHDDSFVHLLDAPEGAGFVRDVERGVFVLAPRNGS